MATRFAMLLTMLLACAALALPAPAMAAPVLPDAILDGPIPREYYDLRGTPRADPEKPADEIARETARADAHELACQSGAGADRWASCAALGRAYRLGEGRPQNRPVAELLMRRACDNQNSGGCYELGDLLSSRPDDADAQIGLQFFARACALGTLTGCDRQADALAWSMFGNPDPAAAEALRRDTCNRGGRAACAALAGLLLQQDRSREEQDEGRALLDRQCRGGDPVACRNAAAHWEKLIMPDTAVRYDDYIALGCDAGDAGLCRDRATRLLPYAIGSDAAQFAPAQAALDRACTLERFYCEAAESLRTVPNLIAGCDAGDQASCRQFGMLLASDQSPVRDARRALTLLAPQCDAGDAAVCGVAARLMITQWRSGDAGDPVRLEAFLRRSCEGGEPASCERLAAMLAAGDLLPQDIAAASLLYIDICETREYNYTACQFLEEMAQADPATPLTLASADYVPEPTPEEIAEAAEQAERERIENERQVREEKERACTTTTVVFEGQSYTDKLCDSVVRVLRGYAARVGEAPWQALIWRPETLTRPLTPAERVKCGGAVIRDGWILTAAHCLTEDGGVSIVKAGHRVRLGLNNPLSDEGHSYPIIRAIAHPDFKRKPLSFDIALVQYDTRRGQQGRVVISPRRIRLDPLPLDQRDLARTSRVVTYGWGETSVGTGLVPDHLRAARVRLRDRQACTADTRFEDTFRRDSLICADDTRAADGGQACSGDSGGPLITYGDADKIPTVIGVVSGGKACGTAGRPSRYTRIAHPRVTAWLRSHVPGFGSR
ncbi:trypsin-like serine protease [Erythrobacter sp. R86502]|uniref:trypsin-like serine protease n=1 Tax=Erythrobacter sp. R86502 TaxID=3093846 RepID=UPI0036D214AA